MSSRPARSTDPDRRPPGAVRAGLARRSFLGGLGAGVLALGASGCSTASKAGSLLDRSGLRPIALSYGPGTARSGDLWLPLKRAAPRVGVVVLIHGGYWRPGFDRTLMSPLARDLAGRGWAAWNIEYRATGEGGGWPGTFLDVAAAVDHLTTLAGPHRLDLDRIAVVGHSAGGTLALWTAGRAKLPAGAPGAGPAVRPAIVVSQAGINNLIAGVFEALDGDAVSSFMGADPKAAGDRYSLASPTELLPLGVPQVIEYATADTIVPSDQATAYAGKAQRAGDEVTLVPVRTSDHRALIDPSRPGWSQVKARLADVLDD